MDNEKLERLVLRLLKSTLNKEMQWIESTYKPELSNSKLIDKVYEGTFKNQLFAIFKITYENYEPYLDRYYMSEGSVLHLINDEHELQWEIFNVDELGRLYNSVKYESEGIDDKLDDLLSD